MRVLFVSPPGICHFFPLVPLSWAFRLAGHEVLYAFAEHSDEAASAGLHVVDVAPGYSKLAVAGQNREQWEKMTSERLEDLNDFAPLLAEANRPMVDGLIRLATRWRPDLVVHEQIATAGLLAAARIGVPAVQHNVGFTPTNGVHASVLKHLADLADRHDIGGTPEPVAVVEVVPPSMLPGGPEGWPIAFVPYNGGRILPDWLFERQDRPRIAVTLGSLAEQFTGLAAAEAIIRIAPAVDAEFVLALGDVDLGRLGQLPPNVRAVGWVPLTALLKTCAAVVHHGGGSTTLTSLEAGTPQLVVPTLGDQPINGEAVRDRGVGLTAPAGEVDAALVRRLLAEERFRTAAAEVRAEMRSLPSPAETVSRLSALAA
ncbi:MAG: hypothetical protein V7603_5541 [Micromonosporaceae bacterium]|jgi:UDP:flavonoid glycosyltransferase YjiC (YdhE family)